MIFATLVIFLSAVGCCMARRWGWGALMMLVTFGMLVVQSNGA
jgi:hypothetical protein